ncbi:hypothetical protein Pyn_14011 [Prunus yedoensis var. nudiflora]|uniref:Uncharacterized protein n=1 Tax=Prunus yedoensis var. nudiflora TaxID=2094558 RepID=A0A314V442_PRUYE|nr:hypothetical protein Pyn_14011 [Prunus yedoensis var. nudiflora]
MQTLHFQFLLQQQHQNLELFLIIPTSSIPSSAMSSLLSVQFLYPPMLWLIGNDDVVAMEDLANIWVVAGGERKHLRWVGLLALSGCELATSLLASGCLGGWWLWLVSCAWVERCNKEKTIAKGSGLVLPFHAGLNKNT